MKIEIAENLIYCYLKHVEGCRIVQTNWKTSSKWKVTEYDDQQARILFEKIKESPSFKDIFKNSSFNQLIKQAEIDVIGLNTTEKSVFGIDVAFHTAGLNYGEASETASRILKKIFRTIFVMQSYFSDFNKFNSYFVTPKVNPSTKAFIDPLIQEAKDLINDDFITIEFISNDDFYSNFVDPLTDEMFDDNDTMELFARAVKLIQLDPRVKTAQITKAFSKKKSHLITEKRTEDGMKIGQFIQFNLRKIFEGHLLSEDEIQNLQNKEYSKKVFNQDLEVLREQNKETRDAKGRNRYYANELFCGNYHLSAQWNESHWEPLLTWLKKIKKQLA
jgi:hypothetical protein